jgi:hypothetical protein
MPPHTPTSIPPGAFIPAGQLDQLEQLEALHRAHCALCGHPRATLAQLAAAAREAHAARYADGLVRILAPGVSLPPPPPPERPRLRSLVSGDGSQRPRVVLAEPHDAPAGGMG